MKSENNTQIVLELGDDGSYAINQQPVPKDQLDTQLHAIYDARPAKLLFLKPGQNGSIRTSSRPWTSPRARESRSSGSRPKEAYR